MSYPHFSNECHEYHDVVRDYAAGPRPDIVVLCGSTRFRAMIDSERRRLTLQGKIVIGPEIFARVESGALLQKEKDQLDELHMRKIDLADCVHVVNVNGYIGNSTHHEIEYARSIGKPVTYFADETDDLA